MHTGYSDKWIIHINNLRHWRANSYTHFSVSKVSAYINEPVPIGPKAKVFIEENYGHYLHPELYEMVPKQISVPTKIAMYTAVTNFSTPLDEAFSVGRAPMTITATILLTLVSIAHA